MKIWHFINDWRLSKVLLVQLWAHQKDLNFQFKQLIRKTCNKPQSEHKKKRRRLHIASHLMNSFKICCACMRFSHFLRQEVFDRLSIAYIKMYDSKLHSSHEPCMSYELMQYCSMRGKKCAVPIWRAHGIDFEWNPFEPSMSFELAYDPVCSIRFPAPKALC